MSLDTTRVDPAVLDAIGRSKVLIVPTSPDDDSYARARAAARDLIAGSGAQDGPTVVLYDRSDERWTDTPHPEGPFGPDEIDTERRPHLADQMAEFTASGVDVKAWYASVPALTAIISAIQGLEADAVLVPEELDRPRIMDRLQAGDDTAEMIGRVLDQNLDRPVRLLVLGDGQITVSTTTPATDRADAAPSNET